MTLLRYTLGNITVQMAALRTNLMFSTVFLLVLTTAVSSAKCTGQWTLLNEMEYCVGRETLTFNDSREFCEGYSADLIVLDSATRFNDLLSLLNATSNEHGGAVIDFFIGAYQRQCVEDVDAGCSWLEPYTGEWYWVDSDLPITPSSNTYWRVLELSLPYISAYENLTALQLDKQHYKVGSDGKVFAIDGFNADTMFLDKLFPLCARQLKTNAEKTVDKNNDAVQNTNYRYFYLLMYFAIAIFVY